MASSIRRSFVISMIGLLAFTFLALAPAARAAGGGLVVTDDLGNAVALKQPAQRIVSLAPSVTEIVYAAGAGSRLVGVSAYSDWPPAARKLPVVGDAFRIDLERIAALKPDLVIAWASATPASARQALAKLGIPVLLFAPRKLADIAAEIRLVGRAAGTAATADRAAAAFLAERNRLAQAYRSRTRVRVFYEISADPLYTVGGKQIISQVVALCGGHNIFADLGALAPTVDRGAVLARDPQAILTGAGPRAHQRLAAWKRWPWLAAVRHDNLFTVPGDLLGRPGPRLLQGAAAVCRVLDRARRKLSDAGSKP